MVLIRGDSNGLTPAEPQCPVHKATLICQLTAATATWHSQTFRIQLCKSDLLGLGLQVGLSEGGYVS